MRARRVAACLAALVVSALGQTPVRSLADVSARRAGDFGPKLEGEIVVVRGTVASHPVAYAFYSHLTIQDQGRGLVLEGAPAKFASLQPGNQVEVRGLVSKRAGLPVLQPAQIQVLARGPAPAPQPLTPAALQSLSRVGRLVVTEGRVVQRGENAGGELLLIGDAKNPLRVFLPRLPAHSGPSGLERFETGDKVRVTGIVSQQCPFPPYDRHFQVAISDADSVVLLRKRWLIPPASLSALAVMIPGPNTARTMKRRRRQDQKRAEMARRGRCGTSGLTDRSLARAGALRRTRWQPVRRQP